MLHYRHGVSFNMHLLYLTFGENLQNHVQAQFSILSFLAKNDSIKSINVITDEPGFYANIKDRVNLIEVTSYRLKEWKGPFDFFWRIKIKAIEMLCNLYPGEAILYLDSDTFLFGNPGLLTTAGNKAYMHEDEGSLANKTSKTARKMWLQLKNKRFGGIIILATHNMWNAGVVYTPNTSKNKENLLALTICDAMCEQGVTRRLIEQFSISVALQETYGLQPAAASIAHYWSNKETWNKIISDFFITMHFQNTTPSQVIAALETFDYSQAAVKQKIRSTNSRLKNFADKMYPPQHVAFVNTKP